MTLRSRHGNARNRGAGPVIEVLPIDEQPAGVPDLSAAPTPARDASGRYQAGHPQTIAAARAAGRSRARHTVMSHTLGVSSSNPEWVKLKGQAEAFRRAQVRALRESVGGGQCGPAAASCVASASLALAGSRLAFDRGELELFSRLALESRQHLLAAQELAAREAEARRRLPHARTSTDQKLDQLRAGATTPARPPLTKTPKETEKS